MPQRRDLVPMTVYVPPEAKAEAEQRASKMTIAAAALLRMILLGQQPPLSNG